MKIKKSHLKRMNRLVERGETIANVQRKYSQYEYKDVYSQIEESSLLGKKRMVSNRIKKLQGKLSKGNKIKIAKELKDILNSIYIKYRSNGKKLINIRSISK